MATHAEKGLAVLQAIVRECDGAPDAHAWRECRRCLAEHMLETDPDVRKHVAALIVEHNEMVRKWSASPAQEPKK